MSRAAPLRATRVTSTDPSLAEPARLPLGYLEKSQTPLTCLLFLLPMLVLYEVGTQYFTTNAHHPVSRLMAFEDMQRFFRWFGAVGRYLPSLAVAAILICAHIARKDIWELDFGTAMCMGIESVAWALPLFALDALSKSYVPLRVGGLTHGVCNDLVQAMGAGIYEELIFRLAAFTVLSMLLTDLLRVKRGWSILLMVVTTSVLFAKYHYQDGGEVFLWQTFAFRTGAGIYFGALFCRRGFGVTCGCHAAYDIIAVLLPALTGR